jgi:hypothetical protein
VRFTVFKGTVERLFGSPPDHPSARERRVDDDSFHPCRQLAVAAEAVKIARGRQHGVLNGILRGHLVAEQPTCR